VAIHEFNQVARHGQAVTPSPKHQALLTRFCALCFFRLAFTLLAEFP
jgi:hypothetical protein